MTEKNPAMQFNNPAEEDFSDLLDGEYNHFGSHSGAMKVSPPVPYCKYLREKANPSVVHLYTKEMAERSDLVEAYDGPLPEPLTGMRLEFERQLRQATSTAEVERIKDAIREYQQGVAKMQSEESSAVAVAPPPPAV